VNGNKYSLHAVIGYADFVNSIEMVETSCKVEPLGSSCRRGLQLKRSVNHEFHKKQILYELNRPKELW
jgi:hypothetical protein